MSNFSGKPNGTSKEELVDLLRDFFIDSGGSFSNDMIFHLAEYLLLHGVKAPVQCEVCGRQASNGSNPMQYSEESDLKNLCKKQYCEYRR